MDVTVTIDSQPQSVGKLATLLHSAAVLSTVMTFMDGDNIAWNMDIPELDPCLAAFRTLSAGAGEAATDEAFPPFWNRYTEWLEAWMKGLKDLQTAEFSIPTSPDNIRPEARAFTLALLRGEGFAGGELVGAMNALRWAISVLDSLTDALRAQGHTSVAEQYAEGVAFYTELYKALYPAHEQKTTAFVTAA